MKSLFYDIHWTVMNTMERAGYPLRKVLSILDWGSIPSRSGAMMSGFFSDSGTGIR
ncbi:MAG: hypothetical protein M1148_02380 [Candidatus Thermoplasmatota archaeon]|nr:hypothetical protein [Candidatus Thermoplasmatota archaeon]MCL5438029.1 hypothetical protein [Candidatus Thermoplasmatota archaeon]